MDMKVRIDFTIEVDQAVIQTYMDDLETDETMKEFLVTWCSSAGTATLDESIRNAMNQHHTTMVVRQDC
tara:strand:+ start:458 stop:664 length:207 start_codon:yes stop_codon:yes gene_type:complete